MTHSCSSFLKFICDWIGVVHDCYVSVSSSLQNPFCPFVHNSSLPMIFESDEEAKAQMELKVIEENNFCMDLGAAS